MGSRSYRAVIQRILPLPESNEKPSLFIDPVNIKLFKCATATLILDHYLSLEGLDEYRFVMFFPLICTHTDIHAQHCLPLLLLYCVPGRLASGLSSGPGAGGSRQGEGGWLHLLGDLLRGPRSGLARFSCLSSKAQPCGGRQTEKTVYRQRHCHCYCPMCSPLVYSMWMMSALPACLSVLLSMYGMYCIW